MRNILTLLTIIAILGLSTCKKDKDSDPAFCSADWALELEDEFDALIAAYTVYVADMSVANCNAYKAAFQDYIDALKPFLECAAWTAEDRQEVQDAIDDAEEAISELSCE